MSWNTRSTPETLSGAFKLSAPVSFSGEKKSTFSSPESTPEYSGVGVLHNPGFLGKIDTSRTQFLRHIKSIIQVFSQDKKYLY